MLFNSPEFLFFFLPVVLGIFLLLQKVGNLRLILLWLVGCSLFFYAWWNPVYLLLLVFSACVNYSFGLILARGGIKKGRNILFLGIAFNLGLLGYFKYANFFFENMRVAMDWGFNFEYIILPLAISFYTFQQITYLVDTRKGLTEPHGFLEYSLFVCFFPQLIAGPIVHHKEILSQFNTLTDRRKTYSNLSIGSSIFIVGLFKKVVIADGFAQFSNPVFELVSKGDSIYTLDALAGVFSYSFQLYFDFSGYSDMAIGLACLSGIKLPVNFYSPYKSLNMIDFWRRWHMTLSRFLRDYLYITLGGNRKGVPRRYGNLFITMLLGGLWHGAGWPFLVWGGLHGCYLMVNHGWRHLMKTLDLELSHIVSYRLACWVLTFSAVLFAWVIFRADSLSSAGNIFLALSHWDGTQFSPSYTSALKKSGVLEFSSLLLGNDYNVGTIFTLLGLALLACVLFPCTYEMFRKYDVVIDTPLTDQKSAIGLYWQPSQSWGIFIGILAVAALLNLTQVSEFLYFQF